MSKSESKSLDRAVGDAVRAHRQAQGLTQDQLAEYLRAFGLDWDQGAIARLEAGKKERLTFRQALQLLLALQIDAAELIDAPDLTMIELAPGYRLRADVLRQNLDPARPVVPGGVHTPPALDTPDVRRAGRILSPGEAERKAARKLGVPAQLIVDTAVRLWGRRLPDERDTRLTEASSGRSLQAARGHVTRQLLAELAAHLDKEQR